MMPLTDHLYIDPIAAAIAARAQMAEKRQTRLQPEHFDVAEEYVPLYRVYALLALTTGTETTSEHVHDAWSVWTLPIRPDHRSIVPFEQLSPTVQAYDDLYRDAIRTVARLVQAERKPRRLHDAEFAGQPAWDTLTRTLHRFQTTRSVTANAIALSTEMADLLMEQGDAPLEVRQPVAQALDEGAPILMTWDGAPIAVTAGRLVPGYLTVGFSLAVEREAVTMMAAAEEPTQVSTVVQ